MTSPWPRSIIHLDLDAFFVAVERLDDPTLIGKPVIVGGSPDSRGVVASASYEARAFGVRSAMPTAQALRLCPSAIVLSGHRGRYSEMSTRVMAALGEYTPLLEPLSIDEAFLDVTGCDRLFGPPDLLAFAIQRRIDAELHLSASLGVASNKLVAKIASDHRKPHGVTVVRPGEEAAFLAPLEIRRLWGVGPVMARSLNALGVRTIGDLAALPRQDLQRAFAAHGEALWGAAQGIDDSQVVPEHEPKSLSREETFAQDVIEESALRRELLRLSDALASRLRRRQLQASTISLKLRYSDFSTLTRQATLREPTDAGPTIFIYVVKLFEIAWERRRAVRLLGVGASGFSKVERQLSLFDEGPPRQRQLDTALDQIRARFGEGAIRRASLLSDPDELWVSRTSADEEP